MNSIDGAHKQLLGQVRVRQRRSVLLQQSPLGPSHIGTELTRRLRWFARLWALVALAGFGASIYLRGVPFNEAGGSWQQPVQVALLGLAGIGWLIAWKLEWLGASLMLIGASGLGVLAAIQYQPLVSFIPFAILLVPAVIHWLCWQRWQPTYVLIILAAVLAMVIAGGAVAADRTYASYFGPTHPESTTQIEDSATVEWIWSGGVTTHTATVTAQLRDEPELTQIIVSEHSDLRNPRVANGVPTALEDQHVYTYPIDNLRSDTVYYYAVEVNGVLDTARTGTFQTYPDGPASFSFVVGSCASTGSNGAVYDALRESNPLFMLISGDFYYGNIEKNDPEAFLDEMSKSLTAPAQSTLYRSTSIAYVWDDHDYGPNDADETSPSREASLTAYTSIVPHYKLAPGPGADGIYQAFTIGRVRFILTDLRSHRSPASVPDGPNKSMMGEEQKAWFKQQLLEAKGKYPVIFWVSTVPWINEPVEGEDDWGGYAYERAELANFIADNNISGLVVLSGDAHMVAFDDGSNSNYSSVDGSGFPVFHAAALDRVGTTKGGPYSDGAYPGGGQFGEITVIDVGAKEIRVEITGRTWDGEILVRHSVAIDAPSAIDPWPDIFGQIGSGYFTPN